MATPPQTFVLDRSIFNQALYSRMRDFWFTGLPAGASTPPLDLEKRWWGFERSQEQKNAFDGKCHENFGRALEALGPDKLALPAFESYEKDIESAEGIATPLFAEVKEAHSKDSKHGLETLLSLLLILDQMSRNIYRDQAGLRLVFSHYDRLALALLYSSMKLSPSPFEHESIRLRPVIGWWYVMPLMHSEHLPSHELFEEIAMRCKRELEAAGNQEAVEYMGKAFQFENEHVKILKQFGRYPHRNEALGRQNTKKEDEELKRGQTFGVQQGQEKQAWEKSEL